jgi:valyl-tRNA synthetase
VNDYQLAKKHNLPAIIIFDKKGAVKLPSNMATPGDSSARYDGLDRFVVREKLWQDMTEAKLTLKVETLPNQRVPRSQRSGEIIEPMLSTQWFLKMQSMAEKAISQTNSGHLSIIPNRFTKVWYSWLENIHDWCISRQLWWGHRIPVYYVEQDGKAIVSGQGDEEVFVVARSYDEALAKAQAKYGKNATLRQDEDVLDTWFR